MTVPLPPARGPLTDWLFSSLRGEPAGAPPRIDGSPLDGDDFHLALYALQELHYSGWDGVDDSLEWDPHLFAMRQELERWFEAALREAVIAEPPAPGVNLGRLLGRLVEADGGPSLSGYLGARGTLEELSEFLVHRSAYQLKEADPYVWAIPRLRGRPKAALVEIEADEYGGGVAPRMHSQMFCETLEAIGLSGEPNEHVARLPGVTLAGVNAITMLGMQRRLRGALVGHLAAFEMVSSGPSRRIAAGLRRLGLSATATAFYDEHVEADAVHENIAAFDLAGGLARDCPELAGDIVWGAAVMLFLEARFGERLLDAWEAGQSSLLEAPSPVPV